MYFNLINYLQNNSYKHCCQIKKYFCIYFFITYKNLF